MKKVLFFLLAAGFVSAQNVEFTDVNFKKAIIKAYPNLDANKDSEISFEEAKTLTSIRNLSSYPAITNAKGIEAFINLTELNLSQKDLTSINVSSNTKLTTLNLKENKLEGILDLTQLSALKTLELNKNLLTQVLLPENGIIEVLYINENKISQVDVSKLQNLKRLFLVNNEITSLDLSKNLILERLHIDYNKITGLDLSNLSKLNWMSVNNNFLTEIKYSNNPLLKTIIAQNNTIETLNFQDGFPNVLTLINLTGNANFNKIIKDCNDSLPSASVTVEDNCVVLGVNNTVKNRIEIYPNPAIENLYFSKPFFVENYKIFSTEGKLLSSKNTNKEVKSISVSSLQKGLYILNLKTKEGNVIHHFLKK